MADEQLSPPEPAGSAEPGPDDPAHDAPPTDDPAQADVGEEKVPLSPRSVTLTVSMLVSACLVALLAVLPAPFTIESPGPTVNVLGKQDGKPLIAISGAKTYSASGQLRLTTVSATGTPGFRAYPLEVLQAWRSPWSQVSQVVDQPDVTRQQSEQAGQQQMVSSQELATVAALTELGYEVPATLTVAQVSPKTGADGVLAAGDVVLGLDGTPTSDYTALTKVLRATHPGATVTVDVRRGKDELHLPVVTTARDGGGALLGIVLNPTFDPPVHVTINVDNIGGPSAGTMFALGIIDMLTPADEANGKTIAGTGTIDELGDVGAIGGIQQKMAGARRDGAQWFLAPQSNCNEVVGHVPSGLHVVAVSTLHEARQAVVAIGKGDGASLPACRAS